jgi:hypothetical protein
MLTARKTELEHNIASCPNDSLRWPALPLPLPVPTKSIFPRTVPATAHHAVLPPLPAPACSHHPWFYPLSLFPFFLSPRASLLILYHLNLVNYYSVPVGLIRFKCILNSGFFLCNFSLPLGSIPLQHFAHSSLLFIWRRNYGHAVRILDFVYFL